MAQKCSICRHMQRSEIDEQLVRLTPLREIAGRFNVTKSSLSRHWSCLNGALERARDEYGVNAALDVDAELIRLVGVCRKLEVACNEWLTDPNDPNRYMLEPRANEIEVIYFESAPGDQKPTRRRAMLSELLARVEGKLTVTVTHTVSRQTDNRRLLIEVLRQLVAQLDIVAKLRGLYKQPASPNDEEANIKGAAKTLVLLSAQTETPLTIEQAEARIRHALVSTRRLM